MLAWVQIGKTIRKNNSGISCLKKNVEDVLPREIWLLDVCQGNVHAKTYVQDCSLQHGL